MLTIREEHVKALEADKRARFHRELLMLFRKDIPQEVAKYDDAQLLEQIELGHNIARTYDIESERGVTRFIGLRLMTSPHFDEIPQCKAYLKRKDIEPTKKMDLIFTDLVRYMEHNGKGGA